MRFTRSAKGGRSEKRKRELKRRGGKFTSHQITFMTRVEKGS